jgi:hypothetical protein
MIEVIIILVLIAVGMYFVNTYVPMAEPFKKIVNVVAIILVILYLLNYFNVI